jgi:hypothetical protein
VYNGKSAYSTLRPGHSGLGTRIKKPTYHQPHLIPSALPDFISLSLVYTPIFSSSLVSTAALSFHNTHTHSSTVVPNHHGHYQGLSAATDQVSARLQNVVLAMVDGVFRLFGVVDR